MDTSHLSRISPWEDATAFGVTGILLVLIVKLDFLSDAFFFCLDVGQESVHDELLLLDGRCLENQKDKSQVTSGVSLKVGDLIEVCIMLATNMCLAVASGSTGHGVP